MKKYKILFFTKEANGGTGVFIKNISQINPKKFKKFFYLYKKNLLFNFKKQSYIIYKNYPDNLKFSFNKNIIFLTNIFLTYKILLKNSPDLVFTCDPYASIIALIIKKILIKKIKIVCLININLNQFIIQKKSLIYRLLLLKLIKNFYQNANQLIFVSKDLALNMIDSFCFKKNKYQIIYDAIDFQKINKNNQQKNAVIEAMINDKNFKIISIGRLDKQKDFQTIIKAFALVERKIKNISLYIVGDGELKNELKKLANYLKISDKIHFLGWKKNVYPYLKISDLFVFSSHFEGFGIVILEAMACKLPIIATDSPYGPAEILGYGKYGKLVKVGNHQEMATKIEEFIKNPQLKIKYSKLAYQRAKEFDMKKMLKTYENLFIKIIKNE